MGSDDVFYPHKIERQVAFMTEHPEVAWIYSKVQYIDENGKLLPDFFGDDITTDAKPTERLIIDNCIPAMTVLARSRQFAQVGLHTEGLIYEDWEFYVRMSALFKAGFIEEPLAQYRVHSNNVSLTAEPRERARRYLGVLDSLKRNATRYGGELPTPRVQALIEFRRARFLFALEQVDYATEALKSVFRAYPPIQNDPEILINWMRGSYDPESFYDWLNTYLPPFFSESTRSKGEQHLRALLAARAAKRFYEERNFGMARLMARKAVISDSRWAKDRILMIAVLESILGSRVFKQLLKVRRRILTALARVGGKSASLT
jgi:hypothetical protein